MKILMSGSTGLIGTALSELLKKSGHQVKRLVRNKNQLAEDEIAWDPKNGLLEASTIEGFDGIVNLSGENISAKSWDDEEKKLILESRVNSTRLLSEAISKLSRPPKVLVNASAIGYYGCRGEEILTESSPPGQTFLSEVCTAWESAALSAERSGVRVCCERIGMVVSSKGGALKMMMTPFKLGLGGVLGPGHAVHELD